MSGIADPQAVKEVADPNTAADRLDGAVAIALAAADSAAASIAKLLEAVDAQELPDVDTTRYQVMGPLRDEPIDASQLPNAAKIADVDPRYERPHTFGDCGPSWRVEGSAQEETEAAEDMRIATYERAETWHEEALLAQDTLMVPSDPATGWGPEWHLSPIAEEQLSCTRPPSPIVSVQEMAGGSGCDNGADIRTALTLTGPASFSDDDQVQTWVDSGAAGGASELVSTSIVPGADCDPSELPSCSMSPSTPSELTSTSRSATSQKHLAAPLDVKASAWNLYLLQEVSRLKESIEYVQYTVIPAAYDRLEKKFEARNKREESRSAEMSRELARVANLQNLSYQSLVSCDRSSGITHEAPAEPEKDAEEAVSIRWGTVPVPLARRREGRGNIGSAPRQVVDDSRDDSLASISARSLASELAAITAGEIDRFFGIVRKEEERFFQELEAHSRIGMNLEERYSRIKQDLCCRHAQALQSLEAAGSNAVTNLEETVRRVRPVSNASGAGTASAADVQDFMTAASARRHAVQEVGGSATRPMSPVGARPQVHGSPPVPLCQRAVPPEFAGQQQWPQPPRSPTLHPRMVAPARHAAYPSAANGNSVTPQVLVVPTGTSAAVTSVAPSPVAARGGPVSRGALLAHSMNGSASAGSASQRPSKSSGEGHDSLTGSMSFLMQETIFV